MPPLEDLTGSQTVNNLNPAWPLGTDLPDAGDDHLRGIKNVLRNTFPNIAGPVTLTDTEINRGSIPVGSVQAFYQAAAPAGWERVTGMTQTFGMRIIATDGTTGGTGGGTDDPVVNDKVPTHTHDLSGTSGNASNDHTHGFAANSQGMNQNVTHSHGVSDPGHAHGVPIINAVGYNAGSNSAINGAGGGGFNTFGAGTGISIAGANIDHGHYVSGNTGGVSANHTHAIVGTASANGGAANWTPRYLDMILCRRVAA